MFKFIKAVSDNVSDMINGIYHDKPLIFIKAVSDTVLDMINTVYYDKPLILPFGVFMITCTGCSSVPCDCLSDENGFDDDPVFADLLKTEAPKA